MYIPALDQIVAQVHTSATLSKFRTGDSTYVAMPSLDGFKSTIITLAGVAIIIIVVVRMTTAYAKKQWGELIGELIAIVFVGWFVWDTDNAIDTIKEIAKSIFG